MKNIIIFVLGLFFFAACSPKVTLPDRKPKWETNTTQKKTSTTKEEIIPTTKQEITEAPEATEPVEPVRKGAFEKNTVPAAPVVVAGLKREPCYGKCPAYEFKIYSDGLVKYHGISHVEKLGYYSAIVSKVAIVNIQSQAETIGYFWLDQQYPKAGQAQIYDVPQTTSFVKIDEYENRITNRHDSPPALYKFEQYMDEQLEGLNWIPISREEF